VRRLRPCWRWTSSTSTARSPSNGSTSSSLWKSAAAAFAWDGSHLHVFQTPYGEFGIADAELGHRAEAPVTLEQVAPTVRSAIRYTYDFGDDWEHDVVVEKVLNRDSTLSYPRCTGGRGAAPPEDCGGIWATPTSPKP
jgi:hypothetical protein